MRRFCRSHWPALFAIPGVILLLGLLITIKYPIPTVTQVSGAVELGPHPVTIHLSRPVEAVNQLAGLWLLIARPSQKEAARFDDMHYRGGDTFHIEVCDKVMSCVPLTKWSLASGHGERHLIYFVDWEKVRGMQIENIVASADSPSRVFAVHWRDSLK